MNEYKTNKHEQILFKSLFKKKWLNFSNDVLNILCGVENAANQFQVNQKQTNMNELKNKHTLTNKNKHKQT